MDIISGEDLLATVNAFLRHAMNFSESNDTEWPKSGSRDHQNGEQEREGDPEPFWKEDIKSSGCGRERDRADSIFLDTCRMEETRIKGLHGSKSAKQSASFKTRRTSMSLVGFRVFQYTSIVRYELFRSCLFSCSRRY